MTRHVVSSISCLALALLAGCGEPKSLLPPDLSQCDETEIAEPAEASTALEWHRDIEPIVIEKCAGCHFEGSVAPFRLQTYEDVVATAGAIRWAVAEDRMPPWLPADCCQDYARDRSLTAAQKRDLLAWIDQGTPRGEPAPPAVVPPRPGLSREDLVLTIDAPYQPDPTIGDDVVRCFLLPWPYADRRFITGMEARPDNVSLVHHIIVHAVGPGQVDALQALDREDPGTGWDCFGQAVPAHETSGLGGWAPGYEGFDYPDGVGMPIEPGSMVMLTVHYNLSRGSGTDQTAVAFRVDEQVERAAQTIAAAHPLWLVGDGMLIESGDDDVMYRFAYDPTPLLTDGEGFDIHAVSLHMHEWGSAGAMAIEHADGSWTCLLDVPRFDFAWQGNYTLEEPVRFEPGDTLHVECHWDNSDTNQPIRNGRRVEPRDLRWGTDQEMCTGFLLVARD